MIWLLCDIIKVNAANSCVTDSLSVLSCHPALLTARYTEYTEKLYCHLPLTLLLVSYFDSFPLFCNWAVLLYGAFARLFLFRFVSLTSDFIFILIPFHFIKLFSTWVTSLYWAILFCHSCFIELLYFMNLILYFVVGCVTVLAAVTEGFPNILDIYLTSLM